jgi:hypothetical protein
MLASEIINDHLNPSSTFANARCRDNHGALPAAGQGKRLRRASACQPVAFAASDFCAEAFGEAFRDNYAESRRAEQAAFDAWQASHITDFEWQRYFVS